MSLQLQDLSVSLKRGEHLFKAVNMTIEKGQVVCVMGPSGVGKSTLLNAIGGHLSTDFNIHGQVFLNTKEITHKPVAKRNIGVLFQDPLLFPHLSVGDNLAFGLTSAVRDVAQRREQVEQALIDAELGGFYQRNPATLSGGQQSRVALMRALLAEPQALLLDEPFAKLDLDLRHTMREFLFAQVIRKHIPVVLVTHEPADAAAADSPIYYL